MLITLYYQKLVMMKKLGIAGATLITAFGPKVAAAESERQFSRNAVCVLEPIGNSTVKGLISFNQHSVNSQVKIASSLRGLKANTPYSICIHQSGDLTKDDKLLRQPYPEELMKSQEWDLIALTSDFKGTIFVCTQSDDLTLYGDKSIIGRSVAVRLINQLVADIELKTESLGIIGLTKDFATLRPI